MTDDYSVDKETIRKKRRGFVSVDLGDLKDAWEKYCKQNNMTPSKTFREIVKKLTAAGQGGRVFEVQEESLPEPEKMKRMVIRWTETEFLAIKEHSDGYSSPKNWVIDTVRSKLTKTPQFGMKEVEALWESNGQLMRIGTNLNQIARAINRNPLDTDLARIELIEELRLEIRNHTIEVNALLNANLKRWNIK